MTKKVSPVYRTRRVLRYVVKKHLQSEKYAWQGLYEIILRQLNFKIELILAVMVMLLGLFFHITVTEWIIVGFAIALVLISEAFNSVIEAMCDAISKDYSENLRYAKDVAAGAVLLAALLAVAVGIIIFLPYTVQLFREIF